MPDIKELKDIGWALNKEENVWIAYDPALEFNKMGFIYAKLTPGQELKIHYHERLENGDEVFIFPYEGKIELKTIEEDKIKIDPYTIEPDNPISIAFKDKESHGIKNTGDKDIIFLALYAPSFVPGEVKHPNIHNL
ncbi:MAG: hypothetical protein KAI18_04095 [Candidatus Aenigmarchaeota archaeon]|nr:hypothetical protein [Candidatus Aenigmarchaeota archaeon]